MDNSAPRGSLIELMLLCHELLTKPKALTVRDMVAIGLAGPVVMKGNMDAFTVAHNLRGWSKAECKRRGVTMSALFDTPRPDLKWASVKMGRNDYEPVYFEPCEC